MTEREIFKFFDCYSHLSVDAVWHGYFQIIIKSIICLIQGLEFAAMTVCNINSSIWYSLVMWKSLIHNNNCTPYIESVTATVNTNNMRHANQYCNNLRTSAYPRTMISTTVPVGNRIAIPVVALWGFYRLQQRVNNAFGAQIMSASVHRMSKCMTIISQILLFDDLGSREVLCEVRNDLVTRGPNLQ